MTLRRISLAAVLAIGLVNIAQTAIPQTTDYWYVVRDAADLTYKFNSYV